MPVIIHIDVLVPKVAHAAADHSIGCFNYQLLTQGIGKNIPAIPTHRRSKAELVAYFNLEFFISPSFIIHSLYANFILPFFVYNPGNEASGIVYFQSQWKIFSIVPDRSLSG